jgi:hypothetical protein
MAGWLVDADAIAGLFFNQQELAIFFDDGGNSNRGFPDTRHESSLKEPIF